VAPCSGHRATMIAIGCLAETPPLPGFEIIITHEPRDPVTSRLNTIFAQLDMHARRTVAFVRRRELRPDMRNRCTGQITISSSCRRLGPRCRPLHGVTHDIH